MKASYKKEESDAEKKDEKKEEKEDKKELDVKEHVDALVDSEMIHYRKNLKRSCNRI